MKHKNQTIYADPATLARLADEVKNYIGRDFQLHEDRLVVFAIPRSSKKTRKDDQKTDKAERYSKRERNFGYARD